MEITKVVKPFIRRGRPNTFGNIVYLSIIDTSGIPELLLSAKPIWPKIFTLSTHEILS